MLRNFWKRLDSATFPRQTGNDYATDALALSEVEYLKSLDAVDFAETNAEYHRRRIERYKTYGTNKNLLVSSGSGGSSIVHLNVSETVNKPTAGSTTI